MSQEEDKLKDFLTRINTQYRLTGKDTGLSDEEYDSLLALINNDIYKKQVGIEVKKNKILLPVSMGSLNKIKDLIELEAWTKSKGIKPTELSLILPKYDGLSLLIEYKKGEFYRAMTRGDGIHGQDVTEHIKTNILSKIPIKNKFSGFFVGEIMLDKISFDRFFKNDFKNPRNTVAGLLGRKSLSSKLGYLKFIAFSCYSHEEKRIHKTKKEEISFCNEVINYIFEYKIPYLYTKMNKIKEKNLSELLESEKLFLCDGLVIEIDKLQVRNNLGFETNSLNPCYSRAWKPTLDDFASSIIDKIAWNVSKSGYLKPVIHIKPIDLCGVTIQHITGNNAAYIKKNNIGVGAIVQFIRSGDVIPKITKIHEPADCILPKECPSCRSKLIWNEQNIELVCQNKECSAKKLSENIEFFRLMNIESVGPGIVEKLYNYGYKTIQSILLLKEEDFFKLEGFKETLAQKVYTSIHQKLSAAPLARIQHASNFFHSMGEKKLFLLSIFDDKTKKPSLEELIEIKGIHTKTAQVYLDSFDKFWSWLENTPIKIKKITSIQSNYTDKNYVFSGFRSKELEEKLIFLGAKIKTSISKNTHVLVCKNIHVQSSKILKAKQLEIKVQEFEDFFEEINKISP